MAVFAYTYAQFVAAPKPFDQANTIIIVDSAANLAALTPAQIAQFAAANVDSVDSGTDALTLTVQQYDALGTVALTSGDAVTVTLSSAEFAGLSAADFTTFGSKFVNVLDVDGDATNSAVSIDAAKAAALVATGSPGLSIAPGDTVTLADSGANISGLTSLQIGQLAAHGVDTIDATNNALSLTVAQSQALGTVSLTAGQLGMLRRTAWRPLNLRGVRRRRRRRSLPRRGCRPVGRRPLQKGAECSGFRHGSSQLD